MAQSPTLPSCQTRVFQVSQVVKENGCRKINKTFPSSLTPRLLKNDNVTGGRNDVEMTTVLEGCHSKLLRSSEYLSDFRGLLRSWLSQKEHF